MEKTTQGKQRGEEGEDPPCLLNTKRFFRGLVMDSCLPQRFEDKCWSIELIKGILRFERVDYGRISCAFTVEPHVTNPYNTLHGGAVALIAEILAYACVGTVAAEKDFFLGELSTAYLAAIRLHDEVIAEAYLVRRGAHSTVCSVEMRSKGSQKLACTTRATLHHVLSSKM